MYDGDGIWERFGPLGGEPYFAQLRRVRDVDGQVSPGLGVEFHAETVIPQRIAEDYLQQIQTISAEMGHIQLQGETV